jgi:hypothetical protein
MILRDWDVWHVYSSFLDTEKVDLEAAAKVLVQSGAAVCAFHRGGRTWWQTDTGIHSGMTTVTPGTTCSEAQLELVAENGEKCDLGDYATEAWFEASYFRFAEQRVLGDEPRIPPPYVRAVLGEFHLTSDKAGLTVVTYPVVKLFENGIILVEFRIIAPKDEILLEEFIDTFMKLGVIKFDNVLVPPSISELAPKAFYHSVQFWQPHYRAYLAWKERSHYRAVKEKTCEFQSGDFIARLAPLTMDEHQFDTLSSLAQTLFSIVGFIISNPRLGAKYIFLGQRKIIQTGNWWSGRPHVYLIDFEGQRSSAQKNIKAFGAEFGLILGTQVGDKKKVGLRYLSEDLRHFDDFSTFIAQSASLWVWSKNGRERQNAWADANRGHLIYEHHAIIELLEYDYILHRALLAKAEIAKSANVVYSARWAINQLRSDIANASHFGEIRELLIAGLKAMGIEDLRDRIHESLSIREAEASLREMRGNERFRRSITILFGLIATHSLASQILNPIWTFFKWWQPTDQTASRLFFLMIALVLVIIIIAAFARANKKSKK